MIDTITVIDAPCGEGKTTAMISYLNAHPEIPFIYISPLIKTVEDITKQLSQRNAKAPQRDAKTKKQNFLDLLDAGENIVETHQLFLRFTEDDINTIHAKGYTLIIDEALDVIQKFNSVVDKSEQVQKGTIAQWIDNNQIIVDEKTKIVSWNDKEYEDHNFPTFINCTKHHALLYINGNVLMWHFPPKVLQVFDNIFVLTYRFESSFLKCYFDLYGFNYQLMSVVQSDEGYRFSEYVSDSDFRQKNKNLINIYEGKLNDLGNSWYSLSANWQRKHQKSQKMQLLNNIRNYLEYVKKAKSQDVIWTVFKNNADEDDFSFSFGKKPTNPKIKGYTNRFLSSNSKATNDYRDTSVLAYGINKFCDKNIINFFKDQKLDFNQNAYALSEMLQWIFIVNDINICA
ncbi:MAG: hypothetical protein LBL79_04585 [Prevotella sp.]|jgi:hypothetical protein|nr:hypothetical protein [Prevotella sp.]